MRCKTVLAFLLLIGSVFGAAAAEPETPAPQGGLLSLLPQPSETEHSIAVAGRPLAYRAKAGTLALRGGDGGVTARIFYVSYSLKPEAGKNAGARPVTFVFNGGPGAASAYLHLGALGPRILQTGMDGAFLPPPGKLKDNPDTWLDMTDLVFVDPVGTGYSREAPGHKPGEFWGVEQDAASMGAFVRLYLQDANRTASPVFLAGESYGGFRAALMSRTLQEDVGIAPSGILLISPALEFSALRGDEFNPLVPALELPSMAAVNWSRQGFAGEALRTRLAEAERYALSDYLMALAAGPAEADKAASAKVAELTGLPLPLVQRYSARVPVEVFTKELGRPSGQVLSPYDGTLASPDISPEDSRNDSPDAVLDRSVPTLTSAFVDYARRELNFRTDISYRLLAQDPSRQWDYGTSPSRQGFAGVMDDLQKARALNPKMGVLIAHGLTDLVTPYLASRYLVNQLPVLPGAAPIRLQTYAGGHMLYLRADSRAALKRDAAALYGARD